MRRTSARGYTLIELVAVMSIAAILALTAAPVIGSIDRARRATLARELERRLALARAYAISTGNPAGLRVIVSDQTMELLRIANLGASPSAMPASTGDAATAASSSIAAQFGPAAVQSVTLPAGGSTDTIWFDFTGMPHSRAADGTFVSNWTQDGSIVITGGESLTIRRLTGLVER